MHQSPQKQNIGRRDKHAAWDAADVEAERRVPRGEQPKARKAPQREDRPRAAKGRSHPHG